MISQRVFLAVALGVIALGGCKGSKPPVAASGESNQIAANPPSRKPGLWKLVMTMEGVEGSSTMSLCLDEAADKKLSWWGDAESDACSNSLEKQADGSWKFSATCKAPNSDMAVVRQGTASGDFQNSYSLDGSFSITGSPDPRYAGVKNFNAAATYAGECPAGMGPGMADIPGMGIIDPTTIGKAQ